MPLKIKQNQNATSVSVLRKASTALSPALGRTMSGNVNKKPFGTFADSCCGFLPRSLQTAYITSVATDNGKVQDIGHAAICNLKQI